MGDTDDTGDAGDADAPPTLLENRVRFAETDMQGVVFYGTFFTYQDETFNEYLRRIGYRYERMHEEGWTTHTVHAELDYHAPARYEDVVANAMRIDAVGDTSIAAEYVARRADDGELLAEGGVTYVAADFDSGEAVRVPDSFREAVVAFQADPPDPV